MAEIKANILLFSSLYCSIVQVNGWQSTTTFANAAFAARSAGFSSLSDASKSFFVSISQSGLQSVSNCKNGNKCEYVNWFIFWVLFPIALSILLLISSLGFCFGRCCCSCCCRGCSCASCGGNKPTVTYSAGWVVLHQVLYVSSLCLLISFTVLGLLSMIDASSAATTSGDSILSTFGFLSDLLHQIGPNIVQLSPKAYSMAVDVNNRLDGLSTVNLTSKAFVQSLETADGYVQNLQFFVEGCFASVATCGPSQNPTDWNQCTHGEHPVGVGTLMSSNHTNPACRNLKGLSKACPCCGNCSVTRNFLADAISNVPTNFDKFNKRISREEIDSYFQQAASSATNLIQPYQKLVNDTRQTVSSVVSSVEKTKPDRTGVIFAIWAPAWLIVTLALLGLCLAPCSDPSSCAPTSAVAHPGKVGHCLHWAAVVLAVLWVSFVALPAFAVLSAVSVPFSDICKMIPLPGEDPSSFISVFIQGSGLSSGQNISDVFRRCVLVPDGSIVDSSLEERVNAAFDPLRVEKNRITNQTISQFLSAQSQSAPYDQARGDRLATFFFVPC